MKKRALGTIPDKLIQILIHNKIICAKMKENKLENKIYLRQIHNLGRGLNITTEEDHHSKGQFTKIKKMAL